MSALSNLVFSQNTQKGGGSLVKEAVPKPKGIRPGILKTKDILEYKALGSQRKRLIENALSLSSEFGWVKYKFGSADPVQGGVDCSGAIFYILKKSGYLPPRTSAQQFEWILKSGNLTQVSEGIQDLNHSAFENLTPGDLLFWSGTYKPVDGRSSPITHVGIYLGHEKKGDRAVMANATSGRSYRGKRRHGYGVFDFRLPRKGSKARFVGFGPPPGVSVK